MANAKKHLSEVDSKTKGLQNLKSQSTQIEAILVEKTKSIKSAESDIHNKKMEILHLDKRLHEIKSQIDLYSRIEDFVECGFFEMPEYLYETNKRSLLKIKKR